MFIGKELVKISAVAVVLAWSPSVGFAQQMPGLYVSLGGGLNATDQTTVLAAYSKVAPFSQLSVPNTYHPGFAISGAIGYKFESGFRAEFETAFRSNAPGQFVLTSAFPWGFVPYVGKEERYSFMVNGYYDFKAKVPLTDIPLYPYVGAGVGLTLDDWHGVNRTSVNNPYFASSPNSPGQLSTITNLGDETVQRATVQLIGGLEFPISAVPGLSLTTEYRIVAMPQIARVKDNLVWSPSSGTGVSGSEKGGYSKYTGQYNYSYMVGLRYSFGAAPKPVAAAPAPAPAAAAIPAPQPSRSYLVFFDWDKADLTARARQIVADAAQNSAKIGTTRIEVAGHTDTTGTSGYNQSLSMRRAEAVAAELVKDGIARSAISISAFGATKPLVPTAAGVREPQNRRVEIVLK